MVSYTLQKLFLHPLYALCSKQLDLCESDQLAALSTDFFWHLSQWQALARCSIADGKDIRVFLPLQPPFLDVLL